MMISFVIADVWLAGGLVPITTSLGTVGDDDGDCRVLSKPASLSLRCASAGDKPFTSGTSACTGPVDTLMVMSSPAATALLAAGSVPITLPGGTFESGFR